MYTIINNNKINIKIAKAKRDRLKGFLFKKQIDYGLYIPNQNSFHTFFLNDNIDILVLDNNNIVIYKYQNIPKRKSVELNEDNSTTNILMLPKNTTKDCIIGDIINFYK